MAMKAGDCNRAVTRWAKRGHVGVRLWPTPPIGPTAPQTPVEHIALVGVADLHRYGTDEGAQPD